MMALSALSLRSALVNCRLSVWLSGSTTTLSLGKNCCYCAGNFRCEYLPVPVPSRLRSRLCAASVVLIVAPLAFR